ncbi:MAG: hypothetical protein H6734_12400 [Alphaproteobacteria bacterium]|nr:hypothetical protein [Alphaproteobacteria bacterium]
MDGPAELSQRFPLAIEPGLDGAEVRVLVERPAESQRPMLALMAVFGVVLLLAFPLWLAVALSPVLLAGMVYLPKEAGQEEITFTVDTSGVTFGGQRVEASVDYQTLRLGSSSFQMVGGLTRGEHRRLATLLAGRPAGTAADVPEALTELL